MVGGRPRAIGSLALDARGGRVAGGLARFWYAPLGLILAGAIAYGVFWGIDRLVGGDGDGDQPAAAAPAPSATPTTATTPTPPPPTPTPSPVPTTAPAPAAESPAARFRQGEAVVIAGAGADSCLNIRAQADIEAEVLDCLADGTTMTVLEGPTAQGDLNWWRVEAPGVTGWAAEIYLAASP